LGKIDPNHRAVFGLYCGWSDVAKVQIGTAAAWSAGRDDTTDVVTGIVLMQKLERTMDVVKRVRAAVSGSIPTGRCRRVSDRDVLRSRRPRRDHGTDGAAQSAVRGFALIFLIQWVFLGTCLRR